MYLDKFVGHIKRLLDLLWCIFRVILNTLSWWLNTHS